MTTRIAPLALLLLAGCTGNDGGGGRLRDQSALEDDWSLPAWAVVSSNSGFFSEIADASHDVGVRVVDLSWRQLEPAPGVYDTSAALSVVPGYYEDLDFSSLPDQLAAPGDVWLRFWVSDVELSPAWLSSECPGLLPIDGLGYENDEHWPIWDDCVWSHARDAWRHLLLTAGVRSDPRVRFVYAPGAFTYSEFDFDLVDASGVSFAVFDAWFGTMTSDLVAIANGENADPADDAAHKLVYTGEDYPFSSFDAADDLLARDAVAAGMGVRTGITELFNFHLSHVPAYGTTIDADGHMTTDESWDAFAPGRVRATENECYVDCGYTTDVPYYAVKMSDLKALQLRINWIYVVPQVDAGADDSPSFLDSYPELWEWVRLSIGKTPFDSPDAWVALRDAEDRYWLEDDSLSWDGAPYVKNLERWLVQRDVAPDGVSRRGSTVMSDAVGDGGGENGRAYEGRAGSPWLYFDADERFLSAAESVDLKVTWLDSGTGDWSVEYATAGGTAASAPVARTDSGEWRTTTIRLEDAVFDDSLAGATDFRIGSTSDGLEVRFVRLVKIDPP